MAPASRRDFALDFNTQRCSKGGQCQNGGAYFSWLEVTPTVYRVPNELVLQ
jgi:hypothetical protein